MKKLFIRNMICRRCIETVERLLSQHSLKWISVELGEVVLTTEPEADELNKLAVDLEKAGFELIDSRRNVLMEKIKQEIRRYLQTVEKGEGRNKRLSDFLSSKIHYDYSYLSDLFSSVEGITIEKFFITHRIERAKELIVYDEESFSEIAFRLGFSSVHHLSSQFKQVTGLSPGHFRRLGNAKRRGYDEVA
jgi:AraC-like DNA-binding protein